MTEGRLASALIVLHETPPRFNFTQTGTSIPTRPLPWELGVPWTVFVLAGMLAKATQARPRA